MKHWSIVLGAIGALCLWADWVETGAVLMGLGILPWYFAVLRRPTTAVAILMVAPTVVGLVWISPAKAAGVLLLPALLLRMLRDRDKNHATPWVLYGLLALLAWLQVCDLLGTRATNYDFLVTVFGTVSTLTVLHGFVRRPADLVPVAWSQFASIALVSITIPWYATETQLNEMFRTGGLAGEPNTLGNLIARQVSFVLALAAFTKTPAPLRVGVLALLPAVAWALFASNSRSGAIAVLVSLMCFFAIVARSQLSRGIAIAAGLAAIAVAVEFAPTGFKERTIDILASSLGLTDRKVDIVEATSGRYVMNLLAIDVLEHNPLVGVGGGGFLRETASTSFAGTHVHNTYLALGVWGGLPAMVGVLALHAAAVINGMRALPYAGIYRPIVAGVVAAGLGSIGAMVNSPVWMSLPEWTMFGLCAALPTLFVGRAKANAARAEPAAAPSVGLAPPVGGASLRG